MCLFCEDEELDHWLNLCANSYSAFRGEVLEQRLWDQDRRDESRELYCINNLRLIVHFLHSRGRDVDSPVLSFEAASRVRSFLVWMGEGNGVPKGWLPFYALAVKRMAAAGFACGRKTEGYALLEETLTLYEVWSSVPEDELLPLGNLFGGLAMRKHGSCVIAPSGRETALPEAYRFVRTAEDLYRSLTVLTGWEWFNSVREEERFKAAVARAKTMWDKEKIQLQAGT